AADAPPAGGPGHGPPGDPWNSAAAPGDPWNDAAPGPADPWNDAAAAPPADPWGAPAFDPSTGAPSTGPGPIGWDAPGPGEGWNGGGGEWAPAADDRGWGPQAPAGGAPGAPDDP